MPTADPNTDERASQVHELCGVLFDPSDVVLVRPIETWTEGGRKRSRVAYPAVAYPTAGGLVNPKRWSAFLNVTGQERANGYFGVCPRFGPKHYDLAWQIRTVRALWADLDNCSVPQADGRVAAAGLPSPTATVSSGHGVHLYWRLSEPVRIDAPDPPAVFKEFTDQADGRRKPARRYVFDSATKTRLYDLPDALTQTAEHVQTVLAGVARRIGGDHTQDLARMLRLPGTLNRKDERNGVPPVPCELVACDAARRYQLADFERFAEALAPAKPPVRLPSGRKLTATRRNHLVDLLNVCAVAAVGERSDADFAACAWAVEHGLDADEVWREAGAVGKFAELGRDYFDRTWRKAEGRVRDRVYASACRKAGITPSVESPTAAPAAPGASHGGESGSTAAPTAANEKLDDPHLLARTFRRAHAHADGDRWRMYRDEFWEWDGRRWKAVPDGEMRCRCGAFCKRTLDEFNRLELQTSTAEERPTVPKVTRELVSNVFQALGGMVLVSRDVPQPCWLGEEGPDDRPYLALENGLLDVAAFLGGRVDVLRSHSPQWFSPVCLPYRFDPDADCPVWRSILDRNLGGDTGKARLLQQWAGYLLLPDTSQQRFLMMTGEGANGKSVVCAVLRALLGDGNVSSVGLELFGDKFHLAETLGKLANVVPEVGELDRIAEGQLKAFVAGDAMLFERKYKQPFTARPTARLVLATNNPPHFSDKSDGIWRRVDLLRFTVQIPPGERRPGLDKVEFWEQSGELPGILNWALAGLADLRREGRFVVPDHCGSDLRELRMDSNPTRRFLTERYEAGSGATPTLEVYERYKGWCQQTGHRQVSDTTFGKEVVRAFPMVERKRRGPRHARYWAYVGLQLRVEEPTEDNAA